MVEDRIGYRYAKSVFELAEEKKLLKETQADMSLLNELASTNLEFRGLLETPLVKGETKQKIMDKVFAGRLHSELTPMLISMVVRKGREMYLPQMAKSFLELFDTAKGIVRGSLISAVPMTESEQEAIRKTVEKQLDKQFIMEVGTDPELIGGFVLHIADRLFDGSVASSIRRLKQEFSH